MCAGVCVCPVIAVILWNWIERASIDHLPLCVISACCYWHRECEPPAQMQTDKHTHTPIHTHFAMFTEEIQYVVCMGKKYTFPLHNILWKYQHYCPDPVVETCKITALVVLWRTGLCVNDLYASRVFSNGANFYALCSRAATRKFIITICFFNLP